MYWFFIFFFSVSIYHWTKYNHSTFKTAELRLLRFLYIYKQDVSIGEEIYCYRHRQTGTTSDHYNIVHIVLLTRNGKKNILNVWFPDWRPHAKLECSSLIRSDNVIYSAITYECIILWYQIGNNHDVLAENHILSFFNLYNTVKLHQSGLRLIWTPIS